jgi:catechol 2,3-dioxygenase-like lactoylglutathione lyase family enzyme
MKKIIPAVIVLSVFACSHQQKNKPKENINSQRIFKDEFKDSSNQKNRIYVKGLDHIPIAVADLNKTSAFFSKIGFTLKPGRFHANGIKNNHIKFSNGTELEIISSAKRTDSLSSEYDDFIREGDGPAFAGLYSDNHPALSARLQSLQMPVQHEGNMITFRPGHDLHTLFFGSRTPSPTDRLHHFIHKNSSVSLIGAWIAAGNESAWISLFSNLNIDVQQKEKQFPLTQAYKSAVFEDGEIYLLPKTERQNKNHEICGVVIKVTDLKKLTNQLTGQKITIPPVHHFPNHISMYLAPGQALDFWIEFRQMK